MQKGLLLQGTPLPTCKRHTTGVETTKTQAGWTAGAGVEWAFADNWTA